MSNLESWVPSTQWNIIITDTFPLWLNNTNIIFDSFLQHLDVYLITNDSNRPTLKAAMSRHLTDILVDDGNATLRGNHLMLQDISTLHDIADLPTFKSEMPSSRCKKLQFCIKLVVSVKFDKKKTNKYWIWLVVGIIDVIIFIIIIVIFVVWRYRLKKRQREKYLWAINSGLFVFFENLLA